ncbi:MAG TPA: hypothetical protein VFU97_24365 [Xanthobacteraceae bacterium]|nr:hypothetical protein [Xanthobacteraceae bacterium]
MIDEKLKERLRSATVEALLEIRAAYLSTPQANALKHYELIETRMRSAARMTSNPEEWATMMARMLQLPAPSSRYSAALLALTHLAHENKCASEWLDLIEREYSFLLVLMRKIVEERREARAAEKEGAVA